MAFLNIELDNDEGEFLKSIVSIFDAYFLLSEKNIILNYSINDDQLKLHFGKEDLREKKFIDLLTYQNQKESRNELVQKILEKKPSKFEYNLLIDDQIRYYDVFIIVLSNNQILITLQNIGHQKKVEFELAEERSMLKSIIELNPYAIEIKDAEGRHVSANNAFIDMFKSVPPPEYSIFEDPIVKKLGLLDKILTLKEGNVLRLGEHWYDPRDSAIEGNLNLDEVPSSLICHKTVSFPLFDREGKIKNFVTMHEDVTEKKKIEIELAEERNTLKNIIELNPYAIQIKDVEGRHISSNKAFMDMFKSVPPPEYSIFEDPHLKERGIVDKILKLKEGNVVSLGEHWYDVRDSAAASGREYSIEDYPSISICQKIVAFPIFESGGKVKNYVMMHEDITKQKKAEQKLEESEKKYRQLFNSTPYAIWLVDLQGKIIDCNETMNNYMSIFKHTDLIGKSFRDVIKMFLREGDPRFENLDHIFQERFKILLKQGYLEPIEFEISRGDGKPFWITLESSFVKIGKEKLIQVYIKDITERKLTEIELEELRKDLENRVKERTFKLENSERKYQKAYNRANCFKGLFTHDISNMFHTIGNSIDLCDILLKDGITNNDMLEYFEVIEQQINRGKKLINNIRNLSEIEESEMHLKPTEIFEKLRSAILYVKVNFQKREININVKSIFDKIHILTNELLLDVFENILINSVLYNKNEAVEIEINISRLRANENDYIKIEFKDNGIGITDPRKKVIFKENHKKRTGSKGMGLGLSLVAKLLDLCNGKIWVEDRIKGDYTQGSNFVILMPEAE